MNLYPTCTIARSWGDKLGCGLRALYRNRFGGFECPEHHELHQYYVRSYNYHPQPDSYFNKGVIVEEINSGTRLGMLRLYTAFAVWKVFGYKLWKKL